MNKPEWVNDRLPTRADANHVCDVWVWEGGEVQSRNWDAIEPGDRWAPKQACPDPWEPPSVTYEGEVEVQLANSGEMVLVGGLLIDELVEVYKHRNVRITIEDLDA